MDDVGGNGAGCFEVKIWADTAKFTDVVVARFRDLLRKSKVFVKNKAEVSSGVGCSERAVIYFRKLLFKSNKKIVGFRKVESKQIGSHPGRDMIATRALRVSEIFLPDPTRKVEVV